MKKQIMRIILVCLVLILCLLPAAATADGGNQAAVHANPDSYEACGHAGSQTPAQWTAWEQTEALPMPTGSAESVACWQELAQLMAQEVPFVIFGGQYEYDIMSPGLVPDRQGNWRFWANAYWTE